MDNHFCLPKHFQEDVTNDAKTFKHIARLCYDHLPQKEKTVPYHAQEECCDCVSECDERCINHILRVECHDKICNMSMSFGATTCGNRRLQQREYSKTERFKEEEMGWGLRAAEDIEEGSLIIEYVGEVINRKEMLSRFDYQHRFTPSDKNYYVMELGLWGKKYYYFIYFFIYIFHSID